MLTKQRNRTPGSASFSRDLLSKQDPLRNINIPAGNRATRRFTQHNTPAANLPFPRAGNTVPAGSGHLSDMSR